MQPPQSITIGGKQPAAFFVGTGSEFRHEPRVRYMTRQPAFERLLKPQPVELGVIYAPPIETIHFQQATLEELGFAPGSDTHNFRVQYAAFGQEGGHECPVHLALHLWRETNAVGRILHPLVSCDDGSPRMFEISEKDGSRKLGAVKFRSEEGWPPHIPVIYKVKRPK